MNAFEFNKFAGAFLMALLTTLVIGFFANAIVHDKRPAKTAYVIEGAAARPESVAAAPAAAAVEPIAPLLANADAEAGKAVFKQCTACHTADKGGRNGVGPNLWGVFAGPKAHAQGYAYSPAMQAAAQKPGDDGKWTAERLNAFLANPRADIAGTKMAFAGLRKPEDRANVIAYLNSLSDSPQPLK